LQTFGADMKYNPHVHCIVTEGGFDRKWNWIHTYYLPYIVIRITYDKIQFQIKIF
jgi:hypothetical protein